MSEPCSTRITQIASTTPVLPPQTSWPGGLSVPIASTSTAFFLGQDAKRTQSIVMQPLPALTNAARTILTAHSPVPAHSGLQFDAFVDLVHGGDDDAIGFVGVANLSSPLASHFYGVYLAPTSNRTSNTIERIADTSDLAPSSRRWRALSAPVMDYSSRWRSGAAVIYSGSDAVPATSGREYIVRKARGGAHSVETLLDGKACNLSLISAPQMSRSRDGSKRWLVFFARHGLTGAGIYSLALHERRDESGSCASLVAGFGKPIPPPSVSTFAKFGGPVGTEEGQALFVAESSTEGLSGIYAANLTSGALRTLVDTTTTTPQFAAFPHAPSTASGLVTFYADAADASLSGLYAMPLDGKGMRPWPVATLKSSSLVYIFGAYNDFDGRCLSFYGSFQGGDGVFVVDPRQNA